MIISIIIMIIVIIINSSNNDNDDNTNNNNDNNGNTVGMLLDTLLHTTCFATCTAHRSVLQHELAWAFT